MASNEDLEFQLAYLDMALTALKPQADGYQTMANLDMAMYYAELYRRTKRELKRRTKQTRRGASE